MSEEFKIGDKVFLIDKRGDGEIVGVYKKQEASLLDAPDNVYLVMIGGWPYWRNEECIKKLEKQNE